MVNNKLIFLIGFMGAGKSHTGKVLAQKMKIPFFDLDEYIVEKMSMTIPEIFDLKGEEFFRIEEQKCLRDFGVLGNAVIATGGGTPCFFDNMDWMNENGVTIYLKVPAELIAKRIENEQKNRPLMADIQKDELLDFIENAVKERAVFYEKASVIFEQQEDNEIVAQLYKYYLNIVGH